MMCKMFFIDDDASAPAARDIQILFVGQELDSPEALHGDLFCGWMDWTAPPGQMYHYVRVAIEGGALRYEDLQPVPIIVLEALAACMEDEEPA